MTAAVHGALPAHSLFAYGLLGLPLAMAALPVYVQAPAYYAQQLGMALGTTGLVLFLARLVDTAQDPWLGRLIDRAASAGRLAPLLAAAAGVLALAFAGLWLPPVRGGALVWWLAAMLIIAYTAHSVLNIAYLAWGARLSGQVDTLARAAAWREGAGLAGVVLASVLPVWLMHASQSGAAGGMAVYAAVFAVMLAVGVCLLLAAAPPWLRARTAQPPAWRSALGNAAFRRLLLPYFLNAVSVAIPATLAMFFIADRIGKPAWAGVFLGAYFIAGAAGLPLWARLAARSGTAGAWRAGMLLAVLAFAWAGLLGPGDHWPYLVVCVLAGLALGADLTLPPVLLAQLIPPHEQPASYYGVWTLLGKLALALSGLMLPLLAWLGYQPSQQVEVGNRAGWALALSYAVLPCVIKLLALLALSRLVIAAKEKQA
ncbi:Inner membrane symporter YicJ [Andreprevotia sp. IGB-42]|uniref:MFS transporter n=1 Tax=Andreprevotia sp. IGB-42 TaxID=2497473 RepID=UPI00135C06CA|nr:MFS transporter [Andreprevotia sp. IGB-42]KAF0813071.1 Inner membrane symporter YicJ [Andreprevotia sp. IGB-42]